jgi:hypothetical protein
VQTFLRGCATVLVVVVAIDLLGGGDADVGVLYAAIGLGALVGSLLASTITWNGRRARCLGVGVALWGTPLSIVGGAPEAAAALLLFAAIGVGNALVDIGACTLPARLAPDAVMGTHVRNPRSALDARRRVRRGRHLARDRAARQPRRAPRARGSSGRRS